MVIPTAAQLEALRQQADAPADDLLTRLVAEQGPQQAKATFDLLIRRVEMPLNELPPLVQEDMAITLCSFGINTLEGLERMGIDVAN